MKRNAWVGIAVVVAGGVALRSGGCASKKAPDERLVKHFGAICKIAKRNLDTPLPGAKELFRYFGDHGPEMLHDWGETLVLIERIDDDKKHDERARLVSHRFDLVFATCAEPMTEFLSAIEEDPEANALAEHNLVRLNRTLEIIFGGAASLRDLPLLGARLDAALGQR